MKREQLENYIKKSILFFNNNKKMYLLLNEIGVTKKQICFHIIVESTELKKYEEIKKVYRYIKDKILK